MNQLNLEVAGKKERLDAWMGGGDSVVVMAA